MGRFRKVSRNRSKFTLRRHLKICCRFKQARVIRRGACKPQPGNGVLRRPVAKALTNQRRRNRSTMFPVVTMDVDGSCSILGSLHKAEFIRPGSAVVADWQMDVAHPK